MTDQKEVQKVELAWKEVIDNYLVFMESLKRFQALPLDIPTDYLGPELQLVYQRGLQIKKPAWVLEHLEWEHLHRGDLYHLYPRQPQPQDPVDAEGESEKLQEQSSEEPPLEPEGGMTKGKQSVSSSRKPTAKKAG